jgi:hypothetical protein
MSMQGAIYGRANPARYRDPTGRFDVEDYLQDQTWGRLARAYQTSQDTFLGFLAGVEGGAAVGAALVAAPVVGAVAGIATVAGVLTSGSPTVVGAEETFDKASFCARTEGMTAEDVSACSNLAGNLVGGFVVTGVTAPATAAAVRSGLASFKTAMIDSIAESKTISSPSSGRLRAIAIGAEQLSSNQASVLAQLETAGSKTIVPKKSFGQVDLASLSAATGDEFAMFTTGGRRLVVRGTQTSIPISTADGTAQALVDQGWRWSAHVHPDGTLRSSPGDRSVLSVFSNQRSAILDVAGNRMTFTPSGDSIGADWLPRAP